MKNNSIIATGYNGPPKGMKHCAPKSNVCPRTQLLDYESGRFLDKCPATHAETNAIAQAAMNGVGVNGATLYINSVLPCKNCMAVLINAGIKSINCGQVGFYDELSRVIAEQCEVEIYQKEV